MKELVQFDSLKADVTLFVAPAMNIQVSDFKSSQDAIDAGNQIKALMKQVEDKRKALVGPLNDQVKMINDYAKGIKAPLEQVETHIKTQLQAFAHEQEKIRQQELRKLEEARIEAERKAEVERQRLAAELEAKKQAEINSIQEDADVVAELFGGDTSADQMKAVENQAERDRLEAEARLERESAVRSAEIRQKEWDINQQQIKNTRKNWKVEVVDINKVPKEFLVITLNDKMALACARAGNTNIPGLKFTQEISVSLGAKTYVPRRALEGA